MEFRNFFNNYRVKIELIKKGGACWTIRSGFSVSNTKEFTESIMLVVVFFSLSWCAIKGRHIEVDILVKRFSTKPQQILTVMNHLIVTLVGLLIGIQALHASSIPGNGDSSELTRIPAFAFYYIVAFGFFLLSLVMVTLL